MSSSGVLKTDKEIRLITLKKNALINAALIYPNSYSVGMSNLGVHTVYNILNSRIDTLCERVFFEKGYPILIQQQSICCNRKRDLLTVRSAFLFGIFHDSLY